MRQGICVAGNMMVDIKYIINGWPASGELVRIQGEAQRNTGGAVCNTLVALSKLDPDMPLYALGRNGVDTEGDLILKQLCAYSNIDISRVVCEGSSAFTLVMYDQLSKERTFFSSLGVNACFSEDDVIWDGLDCDILHIGYILLLDALDQPDAEYGSRMARLLCHARQRGMRTSIDVVSEAGDRFRKLVPPALRYCDFCIINEFEAAQTTLVPLRDKAGSLLRENIPVALHHMRELGVSTWAVIHSPEGGFGLDEHDNFFSVDSPCLPDGFIKGSVGAGDAFCAGVLCSAEHGWDLQTGIELGVAAATASLSDASATGGIGSIAQVRELYQSLHS